MPDLTLTLDPVAEDATNVPFELVSDSTGARLVEQSYPAPVPVVSWASSADSEGDRAVSYRWPNRKISLKVELVGSTVRTRVNNLEQKVAKIARSGGTLKHVYPDGHYVVFDLITYEGYEPTLGVEYFVGNACMVTLEFTAKPFARGAAVQLSDHTETTLPVLIFTETGVTGDAPALGRLIVDEDQAADQQWVVWGMQRDTYDSASSAALFYEAEGRTPQSAGAIVTQTGASGGGSNNALEATVGSSFSSVMSTQALAGAHLSHFGSYRMFARVMTPTANTGAVSWALEWAAGDFRRYTRNATTVFPVDTWDNTFRIVDLGLVNIPRVATGTQQWEGRILAKSTVAGDKVRVDAFWLVPTERSGEVQSVDSYAAPTVLSARDEFDQSAGALTGKTLPIGGTWTFLTGDTDDYSVSGSGAVTRASVSDTAARLVAAGTATPTALAGAIDISHTQAGAGFALSGVFARYVDASNYARATAFYDTTTSAYRAQLSKVVAGVTTTVSAEIAGIPASTTLTLTVYVYASGQWLLQVVSGGFRDTLIGSDSVFATGGTLASGRFGITDYNFNSGAVTRTLDNFRAWVPSADAAVFASQSIEWRHDGVLREDSTGAVYQQPSSYAGDYLTIPPYAQEAKPCRFIVKGSRGIPGVGADSAIDDISARLTETPRYLVVPD